MVTIMLQNLEKKGLTAIWNLNKKRPFTILNSGILATLKAMLEKLATCELALIDFTHKQCSRFSRFYFLSAKDVFHLICHGLFKELISHN